MHTNEYYTHTKLFRATKSSVNTCTQLKTLHTHMQTHMKTIAHIMQTHENSENK